MASIKQWLLSIWSVLIRPTTKTFTSINKTVENCFGEAIAWITVVVVLYFAPASIIYDDPELFNAMIICIIMVPIWFLLFVFVSHKMNKLLFQDDNYYYDQLLYSSTVIFVLTSLIFYVFVGLIPQLIAQENNIFFVFVPIVYWLLLSTINIKAVFDIGYLQSIIALVISLIISLVGFAIIGSVFMHAIQAIPRFFL